MSAPDAPPPPALLVSDLEVVRGGRPLFSGLAFAVRRHGVLLLRGPNGAGKTSLLLALAGAIRPAGGRIVFHLEGADTEPAARMHLLLPQSGIKPRLTVGENLAFWRAVNGPTGIDVEAALDRVGLGGLGPIEAGHLSTGQLRRLALARLIVSARPIWLLDEPTAALDAEGEALVAAMLRTHCAEGGLAVVATHHDIPVWPDRAPQTIELTAVPA